MTLIEQEDLKFGKGSFVRNLSSGVLMNLLGINKLNKLYHSLAEYTDTEFTEQFLRHFNIDYNVTPPLSTVMPSEGGLIVVSNFPFGGLDGMLLIDAMKNVRQDIKFVGNHLLSRIEPIRNFIIEFDPFHPGSATNISGWRKSSEHLDRGGVLFIFPAGDISTYQKGFTQLGDRKWNESIVKFIRHTEKPVLPLFIQGKNSRKFHILGKIHPLFKIALLPRELQNKRDYHIDIFAGNLVPPYRLNELTAEEYSDFLRNNVELLRRIGTEETPPEPENKPYAPVAPYTPKALVEEMERLCKTNSVFENDRFVILHTQSKDMFMSLMQIAALRNLTEEINSDSDSDRYDVYYSHLFLWDKQEKQIAAGIRTSNGGETWTNHGYDGFPFAEDFVFSDPFLPILENTLVTGKPFIAPGYRQANALLMLLARGLFHISESGHYEYIMGEAEIPISWTDFSRTLLIRYLKKRFFNYSIGTFISPVTPLGPDRTFIDPAILEAIPSIEAMDKIIRDLGCNRISVSPLFKRLLEMNAKVIGLNAALDGSTRMLWLLEISSVPDNLIGNLFSLKSE